mmetsp:Transcript_29997/g.48835  ORF Transcript_29997/g.48835 Transcript_29997/m.48835 type:complete len:90 (-) Transcript_29997:564-833(-)
MGILALFHPEAKKCVEPRAYNSKIVSTEYTIRQIASIVNSKGTGAHSASMHGDSKNAKHRLTIETATIVRRHERLCVILYIFRGCKSKR